MPTNKPLYSYSPKTRPSKFKRPDVNKPRLFFRLLAKRYKKIALIILIPAVLLYFGNYLKNSDIFLIKNIEIEGASNFVNESDLAAIVNDNALGKYILNFDAQLLEQNLTDTFLGAKELTVSTQLPDTIRINIVERIPLAVLYNPKDNSPDYYLVDAGGYVLGIIDIEKTNLPKVEYNEPVHVGIFINKDLVPLYLSLISALDANDVSATSISVAPRTIEFYVSRTKAAPESTTSLISVFLNPKKDIAASVGVLSDLLKQLAQDVKNVDKIDLRYDKVVVQYDED